MIAVAPLLDARRFGAFAVLTPRAIEKIRAGKATEASGHFEQVARTHGLRETGPL
jgi:hypothetical protein